MVTSEISLSLSCRLPNPPPVFVGRSREQAWLSQAIERGAAAAVWGLGGLGKSALVRQTIHHDFPGQVARTVFVGVRPGDTVPQLLLQVVRVLGQAAGHAWDDLSGALGDPEALLARALDLADGHEAWLVLDDLHHLPSGSGGELLQRVGRYARASRWVATSREDLEPGGAELGGQVLLLEGLPDVEMAQLALELKPVLAADEGERQRAVRAAAGSPWRLQQWLEGLAAAGGLAPGPGEDWLAGLTGEGRRLLTTLASLEQPLPDEVLRAVEPAAADELLQTLVRRGIVEQGPRGVRLHDVARSLLGTQPMASPAASGERARLARALGQCEQVSARLESVRLLLGSGAVDQAGDLLGRCYDAIRAGGQVPRLWSILAASGAGAALRSWRLRCALELGRGDALQWALDEPAPCGDPAERLLWAEAQLLGGRAERALEVAGEVAAAPDRARLLEARALLVLGRAPEAAGRLEEPAGDAHEARRRALLARALVMSGEQERALGLAQGLEADVAGLPADARQQVQQDRLTVYSNAGRLRDQGAILEREALDGGPAATALLYSRQARFRRALLAIESGRLADAARLMARLGEVDDAPEHRLLVRMNRIRLRMARGEFAGLDAYIDETLAEAEANQPQIYGWAMVARLLDNIIEGRGERGTAWSARVPEGAGPQTPYVAAFRRILALRQGQQPAAEAGELPRAMDVQLATRLGLAERDLLAERFFEAETAARIALHLAERHGYMLYAADARVTLGEIALATGDDAGASRIAGELGEQAGRMPSPRYAAQARFFALTAEPSTLDGGALEQLALLVDVAPVVARRARALLDPATPADALDQRVVGAVLRRAGIVLQPCAASDAPWRAGWGIDARHRAVWLPGGRRVALGGQDLLWRLLRTLSEQGAQTKDQLARQVWELGDYHPLRDDKRIHVAVRRLRALLEDDPARPTRIVTTDAGYAPGATEPLRRWDPPVSAT